jgi:hypothetical protein
MQRLFENKGAHKEKSNEALPKDAPNVFDSVNDYKETLSTTLAWLFSPLLGLSLLINEAYQFVNGRAKQSDAAIVIGEVLFNQSNEEVIIVGKFEISVNEEDHVVLKDLESQKTLNTHRTKKDIKKDFEESLAGAINSSTKLPPQAVMDLHNKLVDQKNNEKIKVIEKLLNSSQETKDSLQLSVEDLFNESDEEVITVGKFELCINGNDHVVVRDLESGKLIHIGRPKEDIIKYLEDELAVAINSMSESQPDALIDLYTQLIENQLMRETNEKKQVIEKLVLSPQAAKDLLQFSVEELKCIAGVLPQVSQDPSELMRYIFITRSEDDYSIQGPDASYTIELKRGRFFLQEDRPNCQQDHSPLKVIELLNPSHLMHQLINSLIEQDIDSSDIDDALLDIWMSNPIDIKDPKIQNFMDGIFIRKISNSENFALELEGEQALQFCLDRVKNFPPEFMLSNNDFFVLLLALGIGHRNDIIKEKAVQLYHEYMNLSEMKLYKNQYTYIGSGPEGNKNEINNNLEEIRDINRDDPAFVFFTTDEGGTSHALIVSQNMLEGMLKPDPNYEWQNVMYCRNNEKTFLKAVAEAYSGFPLFDKEYQNQLSRAKFPKLLDAFDFNFTNPDNNENSIARDYTSLFKDALNMISCEEKLTGHADQVALGKIFGPVLEEEAGITAAHFKQIQTIFGFSEMSATEQAQYLICLAAMFVTYSSASIFGEDGDSPEAIRNYGAGLIVKAKTLDANVFKDEKEVDQSVIWLDKLKGQNGAPTCTEGLKTAMVAHAKKKGFDALAKVKPPGW